MARRSSLLYVFIFLLSASCLQAQVVPREVLDKYQVTWVLFDTDSPLVRTLSESPGWRVEYQDDLATVLARTGQD